VPQYAVDIRFQITAHPGEPEYIFEEFVFDLIGGQLLIVECVFLKELRVPVHMRAVEHAVPIDRLLLKCERLLSQQIRVSLVP
jgi:hypothetical protein